MSYPKLHNFNDMYTPPEAMDYICPFLDKSLWYWECCPGQFHMVDELEHRGFNVCSYSDMDCLTTTPPMDWDFLITNPPFNGNKKFLARAIELGKPFALLLRLEHLGGVDAFRLLHNLDFGVIIPDQRICFISSKTMEQDRAPFHSIWVTHGVDLPKQINYVKEQ